VKMASRRNTGSSSDGTANIHVMSAQPAYPITTNNSRDLVWKHSIPVPVPARSPRQVVDNTQVDVPTVFQLGYQIQPSVPVGNGTISYTHLTGAAYAGSSVNATLAVDRDRNGNPTATSSLTSRTSSHRNTALNTAAQNRILEESMPTILECTDVDDPTMTFTAYPSVALGPSTNASASRTLTERMDVIHDLTTLGYLPPQNPRSVGELRDMLIEVDELEGEDEQEDSG
jgi:hypothetical protein